MAARKPRARLTQLHVLAASVALAGAVAGCVQTSPRVVKIGFVAPFEGRYREIGDEVIPAARLAVKDFAARYPANHLVIELAAYDDRGIATLAEDQARKLVSDPSVRVVIGHWRDETTLASLPVYRQAGIPLIAYTPLDLGDGGGTMNLSPAEADLRQLAQEWGESQTLPVQVLFATGDDPLAAADMLNSTGVKPLTGRVIGGPVWGLRQFHALVGGGEPDLYFVTGAAYPTDLEPGLWQDQSPGQFEVGFKEASLGAPPGMMSVLAYQATWLAIRRAAEDAGISLSESPGEDIQFGTTGRRLNAPVHLYHWENGQPSLVKILR